AAQEARGAGIATYVISVAGRSSLRRHLDHLACEGGTGPNPGDAPYDADNDDVCSYAGDVSGPGAINVTDSAGLTAAFDDILLESIPCAFALDGVISDVAAARAQGQVS